MATIHKAKRVSSHKTHHYAPHKRKLLPRKYQAALHFAKNTNHDVNKKPYRMMGLAMLAGVCMGFLMHRHPSSAE